MSGKQQAEASIEGFRAALIGSTIDEVEEPDSRKEVEIGYHDGRDYIVEEGEAIGVYYFPDRVSPKRVAIDWDEPDLSRTVVQWENIEEMTESDYK
jgi:hypothetical protein